MKWFICGNFDPWKRRSIQIMPAAMIVSPSSTAANAAATGEDNRYKNDSQLDVPIMSRMVDIPIIFKDGRDEMTPAAKKASDEKDVLLFLSHLSIESITSLQWNQQCIYHRIVKYSKISSSATILDTTKYSSRAALLLDRLVDYLHTGKSIDSGDSYDWSTSIGIIYTFADRPRGDEVKMSDVQYLCAIELCLYAILTLNVTVPLRSSFEALGASLLPITLGNIITSLQRHWGAHIANRALVRIERQLSLQILINCIYILNSHEKVKFYTYLLMPIESMVHQCTHMLEADLFRYISTSYHDAIVKLLFENRLIDDDTIRILISNFLTIYEPKCNQTIEFIIQKIDQHSNTEMDESSFMEVLHALHIVYLIAEKYLSQSELQSCGSWFNTYLSQLKTLLLFLLNKLLSALATLSTSFVSPSRISNRYAEITTYLAQVLLHFAFIMPHFTLGSLATSSLEQSLLQFVRVVFNNSPSQSALVLLDSLPTVSENEEPLLGVSISPLPTTDTSAAPLITYEIGDLVDGKVETNNGGFRWFPGKILLVNQGGTVDVEYSDGDVHRNKPIGDVRPSRRRLQPEPRPEPSAVPASTVADVSEQPIHVIELHKPHPVLSSPLAASIRHPDYWIAISPEAATAQKGTKEVSASGTEEVSASMLQAAPPVLLPAAAVANGSSQKLSSKSSKLSHKGGAHQQQLGSASTLTHHASSLSNPEDFLSVSSSSCRSEESDRIFSIPSVVDNSEVRRQSSSTQLLYRAQQQQQQGQHRVPPILLDTSALAALRITPSNQSLSSFLVSTEMKSSRSTRLVSYREDRAETARSNLARNDSFRSTSRQQQQQIVGTSNRTSVLGNDGLRRSHGKAPLSIKSSENAPQAVAASSSFSSRDNDQFIRQSSQTLESLVRDEISTMEGMLIRAYILIAATLLKLVVDHLHERHIRSSHDSVTGCFFTLREVLEICPIPDLDALYILFSTRVSTSYTRMLRLLSSHYFSQKYAAAMKNSGVIIGEGSFGSVYQIELHNDNITTSNDIQTKYAVKRLSRERARDDPCRLVDIYMEIACMETLLSTSAAPMYLEYGIAKDTDEYWIVMECGTMSLSQWRRNINSCGSKISNVALGQENQQQQLDMKMFWLLLEIYIEVLDVVQIVHDAGIIHFDIKCDNFIFRRPPVLEDYIHHRSDTKNNLQQQQQQRRTFSLFLVDFGESVLISNSHNGEDLIETPSNLITLDRSRGTLAVQSPEMIAVQQSPQIDPKMHQNDSELHQNSPKVFPPPSFASDIWSCGCLLIELLTSSYLFSDKSWMDLFLLLCVEKGIEMSKLISTMMRGLVISDLDRGDHENIASALIVALQNVFEIDVDKRQSLSKTKLSIIGIIDWLSSLNITLDNLTEQPIKHRHDTNNTPNRHNMLQYSWLPYSSDSTEEQVHIPRGVIRLTETIYLNFGVPLQNSNSSSNTASSSSHTSGITRSKSLSPATEMGDIISSSGLSEFTYNMCSNMLVELLAEKKNNIQIVKATHILKPKSVVPVPVPVPLAKVDEGHLIVDMESACELCMDDYGSFVLSRTSLELLVHLLLKNNNSVKLM